MASKVLEAPVTKKTSDAASVRSGTASSRTGSGHAASVQQVYDDRAAYLTELDIILFELLFQMRNVPDVASNLPRTVHSTSGSLFRLAWRTCKGHALTLRLRSFPLFVTAGGGLQAPGSSLSVLTKVLCLSIRPGPAQQPSGKLTVKVSHLAAVTLCHRLLGSAEPLHW